jgi:hypothetical protein
MKFGTVTVSLSIVSMKNTIWILARCGFFFCGEARVAAGPPTGRIRHRAHPGPSRMPRSVAELSLRLQQITQSAWPFSGSGDPFRRENSHQGRNELRSLRAPRPVAARLPLAAAAKPRPEPGPPSATSSRPPLRGLSRSPSHSILSSTSSARFPLAHSPSPPHSLSLSLLRSVACERRRRQGIRKT